MKSSDDYYQAGYEQGQQDEQDRILKILETFIDFIQMSKK